jgi:DNA polymerase-3 subunit alpha
VLEGQARHASVHAAGVIVATRPARGRAAVQAVGQSDEVITQWDGPTCEKMGLLKMDFLGLRTLSIIERAKKLIRETLPTRAIWEAIFTGWDLRRMSGTLKEVAPARPRSSRRTTDPRLRPVPARGHDRRVPVRIGRHAPAAARDEARPPRGPDRRQRAVPPGPMDLIPDYNARKHGQQPVPTVHPIVDKLHEPRPTA